MDDNAGAPPTAPASANPPPLIEFGDFMSLPGAPVPEATGSVASAPRVSAGNAARLPAETPAAPTFVEAGAGRAPMPLRTPAEVVEAAARVSRREAEASAREARAAERESALAMADFTARASRATRAPRPPSRWPRRRTPPRPPPRRRARPTLFRAANLDRRENAVRARERAVAERERGAGAEAVAERERVAARREAAATMMADDARRRARTRSRRSRRRYATKRRT